MESTLGDPGIPTQRRRIALVIRGLAGRSGGAEKVFCDHANRLSAVGHEVTCFSFDKSNKAPFYTLAPEVRHINVLGPWWLPLFWLVQAVTAIRFLKIMESRLKWISRHLVFSSLLRRSLQKGRPDLVISFMPFANTAALLDVQKLGIPVIACNHNVPFYDYEHPSRWDNKFAYSRKRQIKLLDSAAAIHVLLPHFRDYFPEHLRSRITAIPNFVELEASSPPKAREKLILAVGRLVPVKNYEVLAKAWLLLHDRYPDWRVRHVGGGKLKEALVDVLASKPLAAHSFEFAGITTSISDEYQRASIFCHPAVYEGFGLAPAEALKMGCPVVGYSDCEGMNQFVLHEKNGLLVDRVGQEHALADALERLILDAQFRTMLGHAGPKSVEVFSLKNYMESWINLIEQVTGGGIAR